MRSHFCYKNPRRNNAERKSAVPPVGVPAQALTPTHTRHAVRARPSCCYPGPNPERIETGVASSSGPTRPSPDNSGYPISVFLDVLFR
jgi:hypothetical protein